MPLTETKPASTGRRARPTFEATAQTWQPHNLVSQEIFAREREKIFSNHWVLVGHQNQIAKSVDYFTAEVAGESLIIVRDKCGEIHSFYNVCRHRGARLIENTNGQLSAAIQCPYHAWTYGLDGRLLGAPHMDDVPGFNKGDDPLHAVNVALWEGVIFVNLANSGALTSVLSQREGRKQDGFVSLEDWFAPLNGKFSHWNMSILQPAKRIEYDVRANWKLMFENYSECYHCPGVHPQLQKISPYDSAENDLTEGPFLGGFMRIAKGRSLTMSGNACALGIADKEEEGEEAKHRVFYYSIFPNMLLSLHPEYVMVHQLWPQSPERTLIVCDWLFHPDAFSRKDFRPEDAIEFWDMTNKQDWHVCELSQQGISSRAYQPGPYSSRESIPAAWDEYYLRQVN